MSYRTYKAVNCNHLEVQSIAKKLQDKWGIVAVDAAKKQPYAAVYTVNRDASCPEEFLEKHTVFRWKHPWQTEDVVELLEEWSAEQLQVLVEPSGSYLHGFVERIDSAEGIEIRQIRGKKTRDSKENYDNVPSMHDGKATDVMARIHVGGGSRVWRVRDERQQQLKAVVKQVNRLRQQRDRDRSRLEAELADVWPELGEQLTLKSTTLLRLVVEYGSPEAVVRHESQARDLMRKASRGQVDAEQQTKIIQAARESVGAKSCSQKIRYLQQIAGRLLELKTEIRDAEKRLAGYLEGDEVAERMEDLAGPSATAALIGEVGDPNDFKAAAAYEKAAGLNLVEDTSGQTGQHDSEDNPPPMRISKRGPSRVRKYLYLALQRWLQRCPVAQAWLQHKIAQNAGCKGKERIARVALMRKLIKVLYHIGRGDEYDATKLFDIERLIEKGYEPGGYEDE